MNQNKHYLKVLILPLFFVFSSNMAMFASIFELFEKTKQQKTHEDKLKEIANITTTSEIDTVIRDIKNDIYKEALTEVASISNKSYRQLQREIDNKRTLIKQDLCKEDSRIIKNHGKNMPSTMYEDITNIMLKEKINPHNINLEYIISADDDSGKLAQAKGELYIDNTLRIKPNITIYSDLSLFSELFENPTNQKRFIYYHELQHILLGHEAIKSFISYHELMPILLKLEAIDDKALSYSSPKHKLTSILEREADIHAASINIHNAHAGMKSRCTYGHGHIIDNQAHCKDMQLMYELMKQKEKLSQEDFKI